MPFDPDFPFAPANPSQWWQTRALPHILVQPNAPANEGSTNPAGSDGIDDWFVPTPAPDPDGLPDDWFVPASAGAIASHPDDWTNPNNSNMPAPAAAPSPTPPAPNSQPSAAPPTTPDPSNQPAPLRPDPLAAYWSLIPASRAGAMAWHPPIFLSPGPLSHENIPASAWLTPPPIFLNSPGQLPSPGPAPLDYSLPAYGLLGGIAKLAAPASSDLGPPSAAHGMLGGIGRMIAAAAARDPLSLSGSRGFLGSLANLPVPARAQAASYAPYSGPFLSPDLIGYRAGSHPYPFLPSDLSAGAGPTGPIPDQPPTDQALGAPDTGGDSARPNYLQIAGDDEEEKEHLKLDPWALIGLPEMAPSTSPKALPTFPLGLPIFPRPLPPPAAAPQPSLRPSPSAPLSSALPPPLLGQGANSPGPSGTPIEPESVTPPSPKSGNEGVSRLNLPFGIGPGPYAGEPIPAGPGKRPSAAQQDQINASGAKYGCHTCGAPEPGTPSGDWIGDHQDPSALNPPGQRQYYLPHCRFCSPSQGGLVRAFKRRGR